ncbi:MAG TPA: hypothetical protein VME18_03860 [Acidobacteriaceae bacterium]|nr:hypothetical protein [Acidobacteriaceae bacterium]
MKLIVRAFVLGVFACGASAAVVSFHSTQAMAAMTASHQAVVAAMPMPACGPGGCTTSTK